jgi:hypothetical protein
MASDLYIDKRSLDEIIKSTKPLIQYEFIVTDILRDRDYRWELDYYKDDNQTTYDIIIARTNKENNDYMKFIEENKLLIDKTRDIIEKNNKNDKKIDKKINLKELNTKIEDAIDMISNLNILIKKNNKLLEEYKWLQFIEFNETKNLRVLRNKFQIYNDLDYLRKGVSWICSYSEKLRGNKVDESYVPKEDLSGW